MKRFSDDAVFARNRLNELRIEHFSKENKFTLV